MYGASRTFRGIRKVCQAQISIALQSPKENMLSLSALSTFSGTSTWDLRGILPVLVSGHCQSGHPHIIYKYMLYILYNISMHYFEGFTLP